MLAELDDFVIRTVICHLLNFASITIGCSSVGVVAIPVEVAAAGRFLIIHDSSVLPNLS